MARKKRRDAELDIPVSQRPLTSEQLANFLQISIGTLKRMQHDLPKIKVGGQIRFLAGEVIEALKRRDKPAT